LSLNHVSTTNDNWFALSLPILSESTSHEHAINGSIIFHHPQPYYAEPLSIRLFAVFFGKDPAPLYPKLIGYDELRVRVLSEGTFPVMVRNQKLNQKLFNILEEIEREMKNVAEEEINDFTVLLSAILNYQGYCAQYGIYKNKNDLKEVDFRDKLIEFLSADRQLVKMISKEEELAGGKVEINYAGIPVELKVEKSISDRQAIIDKSKKQAVSYSTATSSQFSILCILDLTKKILPPALTVNNVLLIVPEFHGFEGKTPETQSRLAVVFIDGNTPKPSDY